MKQKEQNQSLYGKIISVLRKPFFRTFAKMVMPPLYNKKQSFYVIII